MSAKKKASQRKTTKRNPKARPVDKLTARQEKVKGLLVATRGLISNREIADELKINPAQVWEEKRKIAFFQDPERIIGWDHEQESEQIIRAISFYEDAIDYLAAELRNVADFEKAKQEEFKRSRVKGRSRVFSIYNTVNLKIGIMNTIGMLRRDMNQFMIQIGLIREAPKRVIFDDASGALGETVQELDAGVKELRGQLASLKKARREAAKENDDG